MHGILATLHALDNYTSVFYEQSDGMINSNYNVTNYIVSNNLLHYDVVQQKIMKEVSLTKNYH